MGRNYCLPVSVGIRMSENRLNFFPLFMEHFSHVLIRVSGRVLLFARRSAPVYETDFYRSEMDGAGSQTPDRAWLLWYGRNSNPGTSLWLLWAVKWFVYLPCITSLNKILQIIVPLTECVLSAVNRFDPLGKYVIHRILLWEINQRHSHITRHKIQNPNSIFICHVPPLLYLR